MLAHWFTLETLASELRTQLSGAILEEIYTQSKDELLATIVDRDRVERTLVLSLGRGLNAAFLRDGRMRAKRNSTDIFSAAFGSTVSWVSAERFSRVLAVDAGPVTLRAHLFNSASSNVFLVGEGGIVSSAFTGSAAFEGRRYESPDDRRATAEGLPGAEGLQGLLARFDGTLERALKDAFPWLGPLYLRELLFRTGLDGGVAARSIDADKSSSIASVIAALLDDARTPAPALYPGAGPGGEVMSVVPLRHLPGGPSRTFASVNDAVREVFSSRRREEGLDDEKADLLEFLRREVKKLGKSLGEAKARAADASSAGEHRRKGTLILTHLHLVRKGEQEVRLTDADGTEVTVRLDRALNPAANANLYFDRARKAETAREESVARAAALEAKLATVTALLAEVEECADVKSVRDLRNRLRKGGGAPVAVDGGERLPYRVFPIAGKYEAWVGKSSSDNDLLTFRHAGPHDWWMHVRGSPGSHVVLKSPSGGAFDPPKEVLRAAAKIAAHYSKMKKAGMVPVAYCERKYVKKPKNAPPGTVTLQREEVIFVEPGLP